jgi:hypothetical protein
MTISRSVNTFTSGGAILFAPPISEENDTSPEVTADTHQIQSISAFLDLPDRDFLKVITSLKIQTIGEKIVAGASTVATYFSFVLFINSASHFPIIQHKIISELQRILYYRCVLDPQIAYNLSLEAATVGTEAVGYTTALSGVALVAGATIGTIQFTKFLYTLRQKKILRDLLKIHQIDIKKNVWMLALSNKDLGKLIALIENHVHLERKMVDAIIKIYFYELSSKELKELNNHIEIHQLRTAILQELDITPSIWARFVTKSQWYANELARYRMPVAGFFAIPGLILMIHESNILGDRINCYISTLVTDSCEVEKQYDQLTEEIILWMFVSFPVIGLTSLAMMSYLLLQSMRFDDLRLKIYKKFHRPFLRWCDDPKWVYKNLAMEIFGIGVKPAIAIYSLTKAAILVNRYAIKVGCQSFWHVLVSGFSNDKDDQYACTAGSKSIADSSFVSDSEIAKFYFFWVSYTLLTYSLTHIIELTTSLRQSFPLARAQKTYEQFVKMNKKSLAFALSGKFIFPLGLALFLTARRFAEQFYQEGDTKIIHLDFDLNQNISSITNSTFLEALCPFDNLTSLINGGYNNLNEISFNFINNNTIQIISAPPCNESIIWMGLVNLFNLETECSPLVEYRGLAYFITVFWMLFGLSVGTLYLAASECQTIPWLYRTIKECLQSTRENEDLEMDYTESDDHTEEEDNGEEEFKRITEEKVPELDRYLLTSHDREESPVREEKPQNTLSKIYSFFSGRSEEPRVTLPPTSRSLTRRFSFQSQGSET